MTVIKGRSKCPKCLGTIAWYDNIPVLSYLFLKGSCRLCNKKISFFYPLVEIITAVITIMVYEKTGFNLLFFVTILFLYGLIVVSIIDINHGIIPNIISIPGTFIFLIFSFFAGISPLESIIGIITGFSVLFSVFALYYLFTNKEGMGMGDIKLLSMIGAFTGIKGVIFTVFLSSLIGTISGIIIIISGKKSIKDSVPFGPYLSIGAFFYVMWGDEILNWYFNLIL